MRARGQKQRWPALGGATTGVPSFPMSTASRQYRKPRPHASNLKALGRGGLDVPAIGWPGLHHSSDLVDCLRVFARPTTVGLHRGPIYRGSTTENKAALGALPTAFIC
jgi:hypothetical protein